MIIIFHIIFLLLENAIVIVYERDESGWWTGECNGKYGNRKLLIS